MSNVRIPVLSALTDLAQPNISYKAVTHPDSAVPEATKSLIQSQTHYLLNTYASTSPPASR
jgi:hypothetical protein